MWKFDFGPGEPADGYKAVSPDCIYTAEQGYGFETTEHVYGRQRQNPAKDAHTRLRSSFCIPLNASFVADVPDGIVLVTVLLGDPLAETITRLRAGEGKHMLPPVHTLPGQFTEAMFTVPIRDGKLRLIVSGTAPRLNALEIVPAPQNLRLFLAGDSTVTDQGMSGYPYTGWGQALPALFKHDVCVDNHAVSGRSSKSFVDEGRLNVILEEMKTGDFLFIQFGHNDQKPDLERATEPFTTYKEHLRLYVDGARSKGGTPVLITPVHRRYFNVDGTLSDTHGDYITAVRELAEEANVPLIDLSARTQELYEELGPEESKELFMWLLPGEYMNFSGGLEDNTHFHENGAVRIANMVTAAVKELDLQPLRMYLR
ncbi:rhamnogalacturonan acetylesterase [Paenibacillus polymyxa]|uniref:rhamnogalacturonan acetylesterase n=1 Tax=Paenibacillus polymyxa TaxID=1406 RepID=UPI0025B70544|nr:rhamnogalacturonan acetylesterase [Paenibacillus polymyxa]MDN4080638.1 rhamnogalacturonan acetylesterase [Paenibacillus polymyxa]MDN4105915.1 rhamnogalacturonan acetylesterase [Paenibacillus polymyxa]MDN4116135.1 rhamnogalacturonan acetylesterase [Paenibacillus polymyxa]